MVILGALAPAAPNPKLAISRWSKLELAFEGPLSQGRGEPNPFGIRFDVLFTGPDGMTFKVPGFYDGDGKGGLDGEVWKVRFAADRNGAWSYRSESSHPKLNGHSGTFQVTDPPPNATEFYRKGRLQYTGERYLKFGDGGYWIKFGADEPENILGKAFGLNDWEAKKREIDYLASAAINSVYIMTHTLDGDGKDVWPWLGDTAEEAKRNHLRFNVAKLEKWRDFFEYIQAKGIVIHLVLEDDSAWTGYDHARYYREIVARFGYLPAVYFNFCEEFNERYSFDDALRYMQLLGEIDPFHHPQAVHNVMIPSAAYVDSPFLQVTSVQTGPSSPAALNRIALEWWEACLARRQRPLVVSFDEARPAEDRRSWWSVYMGGGMWESLVRVPRGFAAAEPAWKELAAAGRFMRGVPFHRMYPANHVVARGGAFCLARPGEVYALYLPGGGTIEVDLPPGNVYRAEWFDPRATGSNDWHESEALEGGRRQLRAPDTQDWALRLTRTRGTAKAPPSAASAKLFSARERAVTVRLAALPVEEADAYAYEILEAPQHGRLSGRGADRVYTPAPGFTGQDRFRWRAKGASGASNTATVEITCSATGVNIPPKAYAQTVVVPAGKAQPFILRYTDADGPGPYQVRIVTAPRHGAVQGMDNDVIYTPSPGFHGEDSLEWTVRDGRDQSNRARVRLIVR